MSAHSDLSPNLELPTPTESRHIKCLLEGKCPSVKLMSRKKNVQSGHTANQVWPKPTLKTWTEPFKICSGVLQMQYFTLAYMKGWSQLPTDGRTITSQLKFLGCIDSSIFLPIQCTPLHNLMKISEYYDLLDFDPNNLSEAKIKHYIDIIKIYIYCILATYNPSF